MPPVQAPIAKQVDHVWQRPTGPASDPWAWLRDRDDPDTVEYLKAENEYSDAWFAEHGGMTILRPAARSHKPEYRCCNNRCPTNGRSASVDFLFLV